MTDREKELRSRIKRSIAAGKKLVHEYRRQRTRRFIYLSGSK